MNWLDRLLESKEEKKQRDLAELAQSDEFRDLVADTASKMVKMQEEEKVKRKKAEEEAHKKKIKEAAENVKLLGESMKDSKQPFVNVLSMEFDKELGIKVHLDYNDAFIRYLNAMGITGKNSDDCIRLWLANLAYDMEQDMLAADYIKHGVPDDELPNMTYDEMFGVSENDPDLQED